MKFATPTLRVSQPKSAFADGSGRWTNRDLDPVPLHRRKWGIVSFIGMSQAMRGEQKKPQTNTSQHTGYRTRLMQLPGSSPVE